MGDILRLLAELHHSRAARIRVAGGGAEGDAPVSQALAPGLPSYYLGKKEDHVDQAFEPDKAAESGWKA